MSKIEVKVITSSESGKSGTVINSGMISGEEYNFSLTGPQALKNYNEMRSNDATVEASLSVIKTPILGADFELDPASQDAADIEVADMVRDNLFHILDWKKNLWEILTYLEFGFSLFEMVIEPMEINGKPRLGLKKLAYRKQTTIIRWEQRDGTPGVNQMTNSGSYDIPMTKLVRFTNRQEGDNFTGRSILRPAYKHWYMKDKLYKIDAVGHERQALGVLDITVPKGATEPDKQRIRKAARALRASENSFIEHPENWIIQFMNMQAGSMKDTEPSINHHDRQIMKNVLAAFMEIGSRGSSGTRNVSEDQSRIFSQAVENVAKYVVDVIQDTVIRTLVDLNFTGRDYPTLRSGKTSDDNVPVISDAVAKYATAGVLHPRPSDENTVRKQIGWGVVKEEELQELFDEATATKATAATALNQPGAAPVVDPDKATEKVEASVTELRALRASVEDAIYGRHKEAA